MPSGEPEAQVMSGEAVVAVDGAHRIMGANRAALQLMAGEMAVGEVLSLSGFLEGPDLALAQSALDAALGQGEPTHHIQAQARDASGQEFKTSHNIVVETVLKSVKEVLDEKITEVELQINFSE